MGKYYRTETVGAGYVPVFVEDEQVQQDRICIVGGDVNHIGHVLRMKTGEKIRISDQSGRSYFCRILEITEEEVWAQIEDTDEMGTEFSHKVYLFRVFLKVIRWN